jgi:hypothetical protein
MIREIVDQWTRWKQSVEKQLFSGRDQQIGSGVVVPRQSWWMIICRREMRLSTADEKKRGWFE